MASELSALEKYKDFHGCGVDYYNGFPRSMPDYHMHDHFEISLIRSGDVRAMLKNRVEHSTKKRLLLAAPLVPHRIVCEGKIPYSRVNVSFHEDFLSEFMPKFKELVSAFGKEGRIISISDEQDEEFYEIIAKASAEKDEYRKKLWLMILLSKISSIAEKRFEQYEKTPAYVVNTINYLQTHYAEKTCAENIAWEAGVGRTTLMTAFKRYTGSTLHDYLTLFRLKQALKLMRDGETQQSAAEKCGLGNACTLIRCFKRYYNMTPKQYLCEK